MNGSRVIWLRLVALLILAGSVAVPSGDLDVVYLSATGTRYHRHNCRTLVYKPKQIKRKEAEQQGYTRCKICKP